VVEDLAAINMARNHSLAGAIYEAMPREMRRQLEYKTRWYGSRLVTAPRNYPSTKTCSRCHNAKGEMPLSERIYRCDVCGLVIERDLNAAINLADYATASSAGRACLMQEVTGARVPVPAGEAGRVDSSWSK
jgi:putative transposase